MILLACLAIIIAPLMAYAIKVSQSNIGMLRREPLSYLYIVSAFVMPMVMFASTTPLVSMALLFS